MVKFKTQYKAEILQEELHRLSGASKVYVYNLGSNPIEVNGLLIPRPETDGISYEILGFDTPFCEVGEVNVTFPDSEGTFKIVEVFSVL